MKASRNPKPESAEKRREARIAELEAQMAEINGRLERHRTFERIVAAVIQDAQQGDELSLFALWFLGSQMISALNSIAHEKPERVFAISRNIFVWPAFISGKRALSELNKELMKTIKLGEGGYFTDAHWQPSACSTQAAVGVFLNALRLRGELGLAPLTVETKRAWFEAGWNDFIARGQRPEQNPFLAPLGKSAVGKKSTARGMSEQTPRMERDDVRAEIKRQVWNAFAKLVNAEWMDSSTTGNAPS